MATINMQTMRYINLLDDVARVKARKCFVYNNVIYFAVHPRFLSKAIGQGGRNLRIIGERLGRRVRIIRDVSANPRAIESFIGSIVSPVEFVSLEIKDGIFILTAGSRTRAASLIGRNKVRLEELNKIIEDYFGRGLRII
ncbi:MAG: hypothetical protein Q8P57_01445 [Candidatus Pacearchaeota archaeon]|nr:hypothetical protein [Candidatus Pacearchaeota archaeon]